MTLFPNLPKRNVPTRRCQTSVSITPSPACWLRAPRCPSPWWLCFTSITIAWFFLQKCSDKKVSDKRVYYTFARTLAPSTKMPKSVVALLHFYNYRMVFFAEICRQEGVRQARLLHLRPHVGSEDQDVQVRGGSAALLQLSHGFFCRNLPSRRCQTSASITPSPARWLRGPRCPSPWWLCFTSITIAWFFLQKFAVKKVSDKRVYYTFARTLAPRTKMPKSVVALLPFYNYRMVFLQKFAVKKVSDKRVYYTFARTLAPSTKMPKSVVALLHFYNYRMVCLQKCADYKVSDKRVYYTFARTLAPSTKMSKSVVALLHFFNYRMVFFFAEMYRQESVRQARLLHLRPHVGSEHQDAQKCADKKVSDKRVYYTFARTLAPSTKVSKSVVALLHFFNWHKFVVVAGKSPAWGSQVKEAIKLEHVKLYSVNWHKFVVVAGNSPAWGSQVKEAIKLTLLSSNWHKFVVVAGKSPAWGSQVKEAIKPTQLNWHVCGCCAESVGSVKEAIVELELLEHVAYQL
ncbi:hypothetical protein J6590_013933 [Homalodisca vitripennis]|nr:hypothetical protein J6590_013933 [Homalodisca vitripennis]